jgi:hypothetical protein
VIISIIQPRDLSSLGTYRTAESSSMESIRIRTEAETTTTIKLGLILYALRVEEIDSNSDLLTKLNGKTCKITITHQYSDKKQGDFNSVKSYDIDLETEAEEDDKKKEE